MFGVMMNLFAGLHNILSDRTLEDPVSHSRDALLSIAMLDAPRSSSTGGSSRVCDEKQLTR